MTVHHITGQLAMTLDTWTQTVIVR